MEHVVIFVEETRRVQEQVERWLCEANGQKDIIRVLQSSAPRNVDRGGEFHGDQIIEMQLTIFYTIRNR